MWLIFLTLILSSVCHAEKLKLGYSVDPSNGWITAELRGQTSAGGFFWRGTKEGWEVSVRATALDSIPEARELSKVEFNNVANLYGKRGNPYEGQISSLVSCEKAYHPKTLSVKVGGEVRPGLLVGANSRKSFGACNSDQIAYWAAYYNFVDERAKTVFSVRIFRQLKSPGPKEIAQANKELEDVAAKILVKDAP